MAAMPTSEFEFRYSQIWLKESKIWWLGVFREGVKCFVLDFFPWSRDPQSSIWPSWPSLTKIVFDGHPYWAHWFEGRDRLGGQHYGEEIGMQRVLNIGLCLCLLWAQLACLLRISRLDFVAFFVLGFDVSSFSAIWEGWLWLRGSTEVREAGAQRAGFASQIGHFLIITIHFLTFCIH